MKLIAELRRRNVFRVAAAYVIVGWLLLQIADVLLGNFGAPEWVFKSFASLLVLGLPLALFLAWAFELTPDGVKRADDPAVPADPSAARGNGLNLMIIFGLVAVIGILIAERTWFAPVEPSNTTSQANARPSIAVLPFLNMSPDADNVFFADGISEELLNILAGIEGLSVASRTSAFSFRGDSTPIPEIASALGVRYVLEGSVRKQGDRVRITSQLIDAESDAHLWSDTYERQLTDIFRVQEEIAQSITSELTGLLIEKPVTVEAPTLNMDAYQSYLRGRSRFHQRFEMDQAIDDLRSAVERDPDFAEAWAFLAATYWLQSSGGYQTIHEPSEMARLAGQAADKAVELDPSIPIGLAVKGQIVADSGTAGAVAESLRLLERAVALSSQDTTPRLWLALLWVELGEIERALPLLESARRLDPLIGINSGVLGVARAIQGRHSEAERLVLDAVERNGLTLWVNIIAIARFHAQDTAGAAELVEASRTILRDHQEIVLAEQIRILEALRDPSRRGGYVDSRAPGPGDYAMASLFFERGDGAFEAAKTQISRPWDILMSAWLPSMQWLREDPRYFQMMHARGRVEYWDSYGYPRGCRPIDEPTGRRLDCGGNSP